MKQKKVKYKARIGAPFKNKEAQSIGEEISAIKKKNPTSIVEKARNPKTALHNCFDWNNSVAGEKWRIQQARNIVNHLVEVKIISGNETEVKCFFPVMNENKENVYVTQAEVFANVSYKKQLLNEMRTTLQNLLRLIDVFSTLEK